MAQVCVVNCFFCEIFQGQQVKKGKKWICKMCGEKQSFRKVFAQGSGKECRQVVQRLNMTTGNVKRQMLEEESIQERSSETTEENEENDDEHEEESSIRTNQSSGSKWNQFISTVSSNATETKELDAESPFTTDRVTFNKYKAQKRKKPMKDATSNDLYENQQKKTIKFEPRKMTYPLYKLNETNQLESCDRDVSDDSPPRLAVGPEEKRRNSANMNVSSQRQTTSSATETCSSAKLSKWSKYT